MSTVGTFIVLTDLEAKNAEAWLCREELEVHLLNARRDYNENRQQLSSASEDSRSLRSQLESAQQVTLWAQITAFKREKVSCL